MGIDPVVGSQPIFFFFFFFWGGGGRGGGTGLVVSLINIRRIKGGMYV